VERALGPVEVLVNCAGVTHRSPAADFPEAEWHRVIAVNLTGVFHGCQVLGRRMLARRSGRIVNIASISGRQGTALLSAYCAAKHGVVGLTRSLAEELRADGIAVNAVCPGSVDTPMLQVGMPGAKPDMSPEDVAGVVLYLAAEAPAALTGSCVDVFG